VPRTVWQPLSTLTRPFRRSTATKGATGDIGGALSAAPGIDV
jgi:hypothetical protein